MTQKKAAPKSSPKTSQPKFNPHLDQLKVAITEEMNFRNKGLEFNKLQNMFCGQGYTRREVIDCINQLVFVGLLEYENQQSTECASRSASVRILVKLAGGEV